MAGSRTVTRRTIARLGCPRNLAQRLFQLGAQQGEIALLAAIAADQHMIRTRIAMKRQQFACENAKAALHPVTDNGAAYLFRDRDAETHRRIAIGTVAHQQDEAVLARL